MPYSSYAMASTCEVCGFNLLSGATFCVRCGLRLGSAAIPVDPFQASLVAKAGAAVLHGPAFLPSLLRFALTVPLSMLLLSSIVRLILHWGGGKGWLGILMLASMLLIGTLLPVRDGDRGGRWILTWIGRIIWGAMLLGLLFELTERGPLRPS
jgi:hypothetical protein